MRSLWYLLYLCHSALAGGLYNPVSYAYSAGSPFIAPQQISPLQYASPLRTSVGYGPLAAARVSQFAAPGVLASPAYAAPYAAPAAYAAPPPFVAPAAYAQPTAYAAPVLAKYAAPVVTKYAAVPAITNVPITRYEAQPGFIQKYVDVAHPKIATSKIHIRRPAIRKQFYDIEERIIVRPIASAVVELDPPVSKTQAGPTLISPALPAAPGIVGAPFPAVPVAAPVPISPLPPRPVYGPPQTQPPPSGSQDEDYTPPSAPENPQFPPPSGPQNPQFPPPSGPQNPQFPPPSGPQNPQFPSQPSAPQNPELPISAPENGQESDDSDSITVENEDISARSGMQQQSRQFQPQAPQFQPQTRQFQPQAPQFQPQTRQFQPQAPQFPPQTRQFQPQAPQFQPQARQFQPQPEGRSQQQNEEAEQEQPQARTNQASLPNPQIMTHTQAILLRRQQLDSLSPQSRSFSEEIIPSSRGSLTEEQSQANQQQLIELLTGRDGVAEVRSGVSIEASGDAGQIRGRVLSVTPAPPSGPADERVSTRRIVVSRPIQTLQEVDVVQPFTKIQRLSVQQPALLKTARVGIASLKTLAPVPVATYGPYSYIH